MAILLAIAAYIVLSGCEVCYADEGYKNFSLGYGSVNPGTVDVKAPLPCALTAKYGFSFARDFKPYVGTGLAYSIPQEVTPVDITQRIKTGVAGQAGIKIRLDKNSSLSLDYKYLYIGPDVLHSNSCAPPQSVGVGVDIKF
jgi:outer membrane protein W